ncbi:MAG TPA: hypothetical protein VMK82_04965, partial [Steroidobacteraceae bacterium]|nr:hypothetical protein [Steroidobacteraceae bacterium]
MFQIDERLKRSPLPSLSGLVIWHRDLPEDFLTPAVTPPGYLFFAPRIHQAAQHCPRLIKTGAF